MEDNTNNTENITEDKPKVLIIAKIKYTCETCNYHTYYKQKIERHCTSLKHYCKIHNVERRKINKCKVENCPYQNIDRSNFRKHCQSHINKELRLIRKMYLKTKLALIDLDMDGADGESEDYKILQQLCETYLENFNATSALTWDQHQAQFDK